MPTCFFATDLHGHTDRYDKLLASIIRDRPAAVFVGGDLLPRSAFSAIQSGQADFVHDYLVPSFTRTRDALGLDYPDIFLILGNDDPRREEEAFIAASADGIWHYIHRQKLLFGAFPIYGLAYVPPTPFLLKDWERYDVSRYVPPGHTPPCDTPLDRAALDGRTYEHVPLDVHVGSIAVQRFIEERQPLLTLHGHVHEAARLTGEWKIQIGRTVCINGAHDGPELALVRFDLESPEAATRDLL